MTFLKCLGRLASSVLFLIGLAIAFLLAIRELIGSPSHSTPAKASRPSSTGPGRDGQGDIRGS